MLGSDNGTRVPVKKQEAWSFYNTGEVQSANKICHELYDAGFVDGEITYLIGCCEMNLGNTVSAITFFNESLAFKESTENTPYVYVALGSAYNVLGNTEEAKKHYLEAKSLNPNLMEVYLGLAEIYLSSEDLDQAYENYLKASTLFPDAALPYYKLGKVAREREDVEQSVQWFRNAVSCDGSIREYQEAFCESLIMSENFEEAKSACDKALELLPFNICILGRKSIASARLGMYGEALQSIEYIINADYFIPDVSVAFLTVSKHVDRCDDAVAYAIKCLAKENIKDTMKSAINTQLGLVMDHLGDFSEAWKYIGKSKKYKRTEDSKIYDPVVQKVITDTQIETFSSATLYTLPKCNEHHDITPIFIVGMPRSGTSLLEQILAAHADVSAGGELPFITEIIQEFSSDIGTTTDWPHCIREVKWEQINAFSRKYLDKLATLNMSQSTSYITDKMPHNFFNLGLIYLLFPNAKIIHSRRNTFDTCISIYFQNFSNGHEYSDSLFDIGTHYHQYQRLMKHWEDNLSIPILNQDYESLVNAPEDNIRKILNFCGLPWDENCLYFNKLKRMVKTASFDQVKQPIYKKSVERWKNYEQYLDDLHYGLERGY